MRRRLTLLVAATTSVVLIAFLVPLAFLVRTVAADRAVTAASEQARGLVTVVATGGVDTIRLTVEQAAAETDEPLTVFLPGGAVVGDRADRTPGVRLAATGRSLSVATDDGQEILVSVQAAGGPAVIRTFVPTAELWRGVVEAWIILALLGLALLAVSLVVAGRLARSLVRPIDELAEVSLRLAAGDLAARAGTTGPPEIVGGAGALNWLAGRIRDLLDHEREQVADLSHRLRTPLTTLRLEAEGLRDPEEAARIAAGVDALEAAVTQTITEARRRADGTDRSCDAAVVVAERVEFWSVLAEDTGRTTDIEVAAGPLPVAVSADDLAAGVDALLGNVFAHTPDGVGFTVQLRLSTSDAVLTVSDDGPGFDSAAAGVRGASGGASTGLGLDIARRTAESAGGELTLANAPTGGALVRIRLPLQLARTRP